MDLDTILTPISPDLPCGPDLEYDPDFVALEQGSQGKPERQTGQIIVAAEEPNWPDIRQRAEALFSRTKDLRVAVLFTRSLVKCDGLEGLAFGLKLLHGLLSNYWESVHPGFDPDDGNVARLNVLASLGNPGFLLRDVRSVNFVSTGSHVRLSVRDVLITLGKFSAAGNEVVPTQAEAEKVLRLPENAASVKAMRDALVSLNEIHIFLGEKVGYDLIPDLQSLQDILKTGLQLCRSSSETGDKPMDENGIAVPSDGGIDNPVPTKFGEIHSREDAVRMLEKICEFIERTEPANPAPLFIRRGQRLMTKNFVEIIQDLAPDSLNQIKQIAGFEPKKT
ncbi:MAG: type VI secretion system protein TssA [Nitrosospira sp.]